MFKVTRIGKVVISVDGYQQPAVFCITVVQDNSVIEPPTLRTSEQPTLQQAEDFLRKFDLANVAPSAIATLQSM